MTRALLLASGLWACTGAPSTPSNTAPPRDSGTPATNQTHLLFPDKDGDGYGLEEGAINSASHRRGYSLREGDCDDRDPLVHPEAEERCNELDDDCDGLADEDLILPTWYADLDGDGFGEDSDKVEACAPPSDTAPKGGDCDDADPDTFPGASEICDDGVRNDCTEGEEPGCRWSGELSLDDAARAWSCQEAKDECGQEVVGGGDVNGDGQPDLLVDVLQTPGASPNSGGGVWWLPGWSAASGDIGVSGIRLWSPDNRRRWYSSQAFLPDLDGDGYDEILIGSVQGAAVYLFFGPLTADRVWTDADVWVDQAAVESFGTVLTADHQMMAISATGAVHTELGWSEDLGQVYLFDDPLAGPFAVADATATLTPSPTLSGMLLGAALCLSDLDGDGVDEVIAGGAASLDWGASLGQLRGGAVYILKGPVKGDLRLDDEDNALVDATSRIQSKESGGNFGARLSCAGDVDGDGLPDLAVAAAGTGLEDTLPGTVALFPGPIAPGVQSVDDAPFLFYGAVTPDYVGWSVTSDSDLDGDGFHDLAFTASSEEDALGAGVFFGPLGGTALANDADAQLHAEVSFEVAGGFDLDQDGFDDLIIDSPYDDTLATNAGTVYLMRGEGP